MLRWKGIWFKIQDVYHDVILIFFLMLHLRIALPSGWIENVWFLPSSTVSELQAAGIHDGGSVEMVRSWLGAIQQLVATTPKFKSNSSIIYERFKLQSLHVLLFLRMVS